MMLTLQICPFRLVTTVRDARNDSESPRTRLDICGLVKFRRLEICPVPVQVHGMQSDLVIARASPR